MPYPFRLTDAAPESEDAAEPDRRKDHRSIAIVVLVSTLLWALVRILFFTGLAGSDDMHYMRFAALWDRTPANPWEARLVGNALTWLGMKLFGKNEVAASLPSVAASLMVLYCAIYGCCRYVGREAALMAGVFIAVLPLDVYFGTTISPFMIMTALMAVGTMAFLASPESTKARYIAAAALALGVVTHLTGFYYVAALVIAALIIDRKRYQPAIVVTLACGLGVIALDMAVFDIAFGDALGRFRVCAAEADNSRTMTPMLADGRFNSAFIIWPIQRLLFSKAFGISLITALVVGGLSFRRLSKPLRLLWLTSAFLWLWVSFGSLVPWAYRPFWHHSRFLHPLALPIALLLASTVWAGVLPFGRKFRRALVSAVIGICVLNLLGSGSWGQNVRISGELLDYVNAHPNKQFLTDYRTLNEMYALGGMATLPQVAAGADTKRSRLLDRNARIAMPDDSFDYDRILINPLNLKRTPAFAAFVESAGGELRFQTAPAYRPICQLVSPLRRYAWAVRKPGARVVTFETQNTHGRRRRTSVAGSCSTDSLHQTP